MEFDAPLVPATLIRRYKRFLADVQTRAGTRLTVHCPNTGSMQGCSTPGLPVWLSDSCNPARKYRYTWELVEVRPDVLVGIHTGRSNRLVREALGAGLLEELRGFSSIRAEVRLPAGGSRIDFLLDGHKQGQRCYLEIKNVTAAVHDGVGLFPDAVSTRGSRHMRHLAECRTAGDRAALVFCVQRNDVEQVQPADQIDPEYGRALRDAVAAGVEVYALGAEVTVSGVRLERRLPVVLSAAGPSPEF